MREQLKRGRDQAAESVRWTATLPIPEFERDYEFVSLSHPDEYPMNEGRVISNRGLDIAVREYDDYFEEQHIEYTNALHSTIRGRGSYLAGPMARYNLNIDKLSPLAREVAADIGFGEVCKNPFHQNRPLYNAGLQGGPVR